MATMTIRNIDEQLKARLRLQAAQHGCSMEKASTAGRIGQRYIPYHRYNAYVVGPAVEGWRIERLIKAVILSRLYALHYAGYNLYKLPTNRP